MHLTHSTYTRTHTQHAHTNTHTHARMHTPAQMQSCSIQDQDQDHDHQAWPSLSSTHSQHTVCVLLLQSLCMRTCRHTNYSYIYIHVHLDNKIISYNKKHIRAVVSSSYHKGQCKFCYITQQSSAIKIQT